MRSLSIATEWPKQFYTVKITIKNQEKWTILKAYQVLFYRIMLQQQLIYFQDPEVENRKLIPAKKEE